MLLHLKLLFRQPLLYHLKLALAYAYILLFCLAVNARQRPIIFFCRARRLQLPALLFDLLGCACQVLLALAQLFEAVLERGLGALSLLCGAVVL